MGAVTVDQSGSLGLVLAVISVVSSIVVVGCIVIVGCVVGIGCVIGIIIRRVVVSQIKPSRMLAFSASKSMRCCGTVFAVLSLFSVFIVSGSVIGSVVVVGIIIRNLV